MKVQNMTSPNGNKVPNPHIIFTSEATFFRSYDSVIVRTDFEDGKRRVTLDETYWNYSRTTAKYRNQFLGETTAETERKIKDGTYKLEDLNK